MDILAMFGIGFLIILGRSIYRVEKRNKWFRQVGLNPYRTDKVLDDEAKLVDTRRTA